MYECCLHTLRVFMLRLGWVGESQDITIDPVLGQASRLKCRGQVLASTKMVRYELHVREMGYGPDAGALVDAYMYSDDKCIVDIENMALQMTGLKKEHVDRVWSGQDQDRVLFSQEQMQEFSNGSPSKAFGQPYRMFDLQRKMARLPRGKLQLVTEVLSSSATAFQLESGHTAKARFITKLILGFTSQIILEKCLIPCF